MSDLFHEGVPDEFIAQVWQRMAWNQQHIFQILTKRPQRMLDWVLEHGGEAVFAGEREEYEESLKEHGWPLRNVWLGVSIEDQARADERIPLLLQTPAAVRWISAEPLLGPVDLRDPPNDMGEPRFSYLERVDGTGPRLNWVVVGGESGPGARPMHPDWARSLRDQCAAVGTPFFFKQWGAWSPEWAWANAVNVDVTTGAARNPNAHMGPRGLAVQSQDTLFLVGKKAAGRVLDGRTHDEYPTQ